MNPIQARQTDLSWDRFAALWMCSPEPGARGLRARLPISWLRALRWLN